MCLALFVFATGFGSRVSTLSLLTSWTPLESRSSIYGIVAIVENLGIMAGEPLLQNVFAASLNLSKFWMGLPFFCSAVSFAIATIVYTG